MAVLTVLRNRAYVGEIHFRGADHPAPHRHLVDREVFDRVQDLLAERGDTPSKRGSTATDYLLAGRVVCVGCGKRFIGGAAHGKQRRYR